MNFKNDIEKIKNSEAFKNLDKKLYLCSCFSIDNEWQYDFYDKKSKKITSFKIGKEIEILEESKAFQKEEVDVEELSLDMVKMELNDALDKVEEIMSKKSAGEEVNKKIIILQCLKVPLWNISFLTSCFNILNVKINAENKEIISEKFESLMNFRVK